MKATSAFHLLQVPLLVIPRQSKAEPQLSGPMNWLLVSREAQIEFLFIWGKTYIDEEAESDDPGNEEEEINWPVDESSREWEEPQQREENGNAGDNLGVDEALLLTLAHGVAALVEVLASDACDNCGEGQLKLKLVICCGGCATNDVTETRGRRGCEVGKRTWPTRRAMPMMRSIAILMVLDYSSVVFWFSSSGLLAQSSIWRSKKVVGAEARNLR